MTDGQVRGTIGYLRMQYPYSEDVMKLCDFAEQHLDKEVNDDRDDSDRSDGTD